MPATRFKIFLQWRIVRYGFVGLVSTGLHVGVAFLFIRFAVRSLFFSNLAGFSAAYFFSYYVQSKWVFNSNFTMGRFFKYFFVQLAALLAAIFISHTATPLNLYLKVVLTAVILPLITFIVHGAWTFSDRMNPPRSLHSFKAFFLVGKKSD